jgi:hypothetical protein
VSLAHAPTAPLQQRRGLGEAGARLAAEPCAIAYLGASLAVQPDGYRPRLHEAIRRRLGQDHRAVPAAIGAIGAVSAVFLMDRFVLAHDPDLCLVDYSSGDDLVNDSPLDEVEEAVEGIAGKLAGASCPACFLHLPRAEWTARCDEVVARWERVADRHGIPSIDAGSPVRALVESGEAGAEDLFTDGVHTSPRGSELIASMVDGALAELAAEGGGEPAGEHHEPAPGGRDYRLARLVSASPADGGAGVPRLYRMSLPYLELSVGEAVTVELDGELVGLAVLRGPDSGRIQLSGDGEESLMVWDRYCWYQRIGTVMPRRRPAAGERLTITLTGPPADVPPSAEPPPQGREPYVAGDTKLKLIGYMVLEDR